MSPHTAGRYQILDKVGEGGMGILYRARDTRLARTVALKLLRADALRDPERKRRFLQEARAASALNHPNIVTIYDVDEAPDGSSYIAMEYVEGRSLDHRLAEGPLPLDEALRLGIEVARALAAAHAAGIVHRDVKPANVMLSRSGAVKVLDFGLAKLAEATGGAARESAETVTKGPKTLSGVILGTPAYMSPEQARGETADARSDVFSFGVLLYELLAGRRPFAGESVAVLLASILRDDPPSIETLRPEVPVDIVAVARRCLARDRNARFQSAEGVLEALLGCQARLSEASRAADSPRRRWLLIAAVFAVAVLGAFLGRVELRAARERRARRETLPEIQRLAGTDQIYAAFSLARANASLLDGDPEFDRLWRDLSVVTTVRTSPPGAEVAVKPYLESDAAWEVLGDSPLTEVRLPVAYLRWRAKKAGYETVEGAFRPMREREFVLTPVGSAIAGMVRVPGGAFTYRNTRLVKLDDSWIDRYEVTNRQYREFVEKGGYRTKSYWKPPFIQTGRTLSWDEAMALLRDATGRPGPAGWELGTYPEGQDDYPVAGVSWYEAAAYAEFAGKSLPTFFHWYRAAELGIVSDILLLSNFGGQGPAPMGRHQGLGPFGTYDQAGNVREWCWNAAGDRRYTLGGAWNDPTYLYQGPEIVSPWDRSPAQGFRCARYAPPPAADTLAPVAFGAITRDYAREKPVSDEVFAAYRSLYSYDRTPLDAREEPADDSSPHWRKETVSFAAAYGDERVRAYLFLPKSAPPPYQVVVYFPPSSALTIRSSADIGVREFSFLVQSGRAVLFPVYKGTYERRLQEGSQGPRESRDLAIQWYKDFARSLDYLETRKDLKADRIGFYGLSLGADAGLLFAALEPRVRVVVLVAGGLSTGEEPGETDPFNFAPRITQPVLLVAGRDDFRNPLELSQKPLMRLLGSQDKRHYVFDGGHVPPRQQEVVRETLDWLDRHLGPI
jgi:formylglycine-generating enzyme required for sulfatase activity/dienelactone hydrolase/predicted Ser/Thr protein kinase